MHIFKTFFILIICFTSATTIHAQSNCSKKSRGLNSGLVQLSTYDGNLFAPQSICHNDKLHLDTSLRVTYEPEKYGLDPTNQVLSGAPLHLVTSAQVGGSFIIMKGFQVSAKLEVPRFQYMISGYQGQYLGLGDLSLESNLHILKRRSLMVAMTSRVVLPTAIGYYKNAYPLHFELGLIARYQALPFLFLNSSFNAGASTALSAARVRERAGLQTIIGAELRLFSWIDIATDLRVLNIYEHSLDSLDLAVALRGHIFAGLGIEWQNVIPIAGNDRNLFQSRLSLLYHF